MEQKDTASPDVFLSYASDDRERVVPLVKALEALGWTVWWDRKIPPGKSFAEVIEEGLTKSKCVVVVWSKRSIKSHWVKTEASVALKHSKLVPVMIDKVTPPLEFLMIHAANLVNWQLGVDNEEFEQVVKAVGNLAGGAYVDIGEADTGNIESESVESRELPPNIAVAPQTVEVVDEYLPPAKELPKRPLSWIKRIVLALVVVGVAIVVIRVAWPPSSDPVQRQPGVYMTESAVKGEPIRRDMVRVIKPAPDAQMPDRPLRFVHDIQGFCLTKDVRVGDRLEWGHLGDCK